VQLTLLGCGSSAGTPVIGCRCATCSSDNPRNRRTRCSATITTRSGEVILIDTGPDLRTQALRESMDRVDAVLYTHTHADHLHGIDDLRSFCQLQRMQIPLYGHPDHLAVIDARFHYAVRSPAGNWDLPILSLNPLLEAASICGVKVTPIPAHHGRSMVYGYRIGGMAYLTDVSEIPAASLQLLRGLDVLLLDCLRYEPHHTHINLEQSLAYAGLIAADRTFLIHMTHELEYGALESLLPPGVQAGYDGLKLNFD